MKIVVLGYHNTGYLCLRELIKKNENVVGVFTHHDNIKENIWFHSVGKLAEEYNIPCFYTDNINHTKWTSHIKNMSPDIIFSFYFRQLINKEILDIPPMGSINLHGSYLPKYRGRCPINWVIINGETKTGVTLHYMTIKPDTGDIIAQKKIPVDIRDTAYTLFKKMETTAISLFIETFPSIKKGTNQRIKQDNSQASYFGGRKLEDGLIDWKSSNMKIYNLIRGVTHPYPGAFTYYEGQKLFIWEADYKVIANFSKKYVPGEIHIYKDKKIFIKTGDGWLSILSCHLEGEKELSATDFIKSSVIRDGDIFN